MSFGALTGGGGASLGSTAGAESGDVSSGLDFSLSTNNAFTVGGSGGFSSSSDASGAGKGNPNVAALPPSQQKPNNTPLYIGAGLFSLIALAAILKK